MSFVISLTCALLATSLQQWARRYARLTQPARCSPEKRARIRAFFAGGVDKMNLPLVVEGLPALIHLAVFLFFAGLIIFLLNVNYSISISVIAWIGPFSVLYAFITFMPMFRPDSPYYTPLSAQVSLISGFILRLLVGIVYLLYCLSVVAAMVYDFVRSRFILVWITICSWTRSSEYHRLRDWYDSDTHRHWYGRAVDRLYRLLSSIVDAISHLGDRIENSGKAAEEITRNRSSEIDLGILDWTISALGEDDALEKFFEVIPGFYNSQMVNDIHRPLPDTFLSKFLDSWGGFVTRNLLSNSISEEIKIRRLVISMNAIKEVCYYDETDRIFSHLSNLRFDQIAPSIQAVQTLAPWCSSSDTTMSELARYTVAKMLPYVQEHDDRWIACTKDVYGLSERILRDHVSRGDDSVFLAILIHAAGHIIRTEPWKWELLLSISKFNILHTHPGLRNEFCALWNDVVRRARTVPYPHIRILSGIRHLYIALHQGTDAAPIAFDASTPSDDPDLENLRVYPLCNIGAHHAHSNAPASIQLLDEPRHSISHPSHSESQLYPSGSTAAQQVDEANVTPGPRSSSDYTHARSPPTIRPEPLTLQANVISDPETVALHLNPLVPGNVSHLSSRSSLYTTDDMHTKEPIPVTPVAGGKASRAGRATLHALPYPDPVPVTAAPSTSVHRQGDVVDTFQLITLSLTFSHLLGGSNKQQGTVAPRSASGITQVSPRINQTHLNIGSTRQTSNQSIGVLPTVTSTSLSGFPSSSTPEGEVDPIEPPSFIESPPLSPGHIPHPLGSLSSSHTTANSDISSRIILTSDAHISTSGGALSTRDNRRDMVRPVPIRISRHENKPTLSTPGIDEHIAALGDHQDDQNGLLR